MAEDIKRMDIKEFRDKGFLHEVNRNFFHPLGLALEVIIDDDTGEEKLGGVWDYRDDPEGIFYSNEVIDKEKINHIESLRKSKLKDRFNAAKEYGVVLDDNGIQIKY